MTGTEAVRVTVDPDGSVLRIGRNRPEKRNAAGPADASRRARRRAGGPLATAGFWFATGCARIWGHLLGGTYRARHGVRYFEGLPRWAYGRGGTTIGAIYLTTDNTGPDVLAHEAVHVEQWRRHGLAFIPLYLAAGVDPLSNRFEIEAGLERGGYLGSTSRPRRRDED